MNKLNVGDYVRTKDGIIAKITDIIEDFSVDCDRDVFDLDNMAMMEIPWNFKDEYLIKSSPNIIDLIEVGDFVNGREIDYIGKEGVYSDYDNAEYYYFESEEIETVVTHEQFENISYKVGE